MGQGFAMHPVRGTAPKPLDDGPGRCECVSQGPYFSHFTGGGLADGEIGVGDIDKEHGNTFGWFAVYSVY